MNTHRTGFRFSEAGQVANELESLLTAVMVSADVVGDGGADRWRLQQELGALEVTLEKALDLVRRLGRLAHGEHTAPLRYEEFAPLPGTGAGFALVDGPRPPVL
jgi:hypothetical protein